MHTHTHTRTQAVRWKPEITRVRVWLQQVRVGVDFDADARLMQERSTSTTSTFNAVGVTKSRLNRRKSALFRVQRRCRLVHGVHLATVELLCVFASRGDRASACEEQKGVEGGQRCF